MLADTRAVYLFIYVNDLAKSREFYEHQLGLHVIEEDAGCVKFDCGQVILALNRAADYNIALPNGKDNSADIVFLVDDLDAVRAVIEARGVQFSKTDWYQPGGITDFYDPDGHWLTLYQPNEEAMTWPSGDRIRAVIRARKGSNRNGAAPLPKHASSSGSNGAPVGLHGSDLFYVFFFVKDPAATQTFYQGYLGLRDLEGGPCSSGPADSDGVVKYDTGGMLMTTHRIYEERTPEQVEEHVCPPREIDLRAMQSVAPAFHVKSVDEAVKELSRKRAQSSVKVSRSDIGAVATLEDPSGHLLFLYEPSARALEKPSGLKIQEILAVKF
jgi:catechol 2,3-dioxygenase-like lactoylglutathione lyase family enzyme